jgi:hypothetical protein
MPRKMAMVHVINRTDCSREWLAKTHDYLNAPRTLFRCFTGQPSPSAPNITRRNGNRIPFPECFGFPPKDKERDKDPNRYDM